MKTQWGLTAFPWELDLAAIKEAFELLTSFVELGLKRKTLLNRLWQVLSPVVGSFGYNRNHAFDFAFEPKILVNWHPKLLAIGLRRHMFLLNCASQPLGLTNKRAFNRQPCRRLR